MHMYVVKLNLNVHYDPAVSHQGIYLEKFTYTGEVHGNVHRLFIITNKTEIQYQ